MNLELLNNILIQNNCIELIKNNENYIFSLIPELKLCKGFNQNNPWHIYDVYDHTLKVVESVPQDIRLKLAALFHDTGKPYVYYVDDKGIGHFYNHWSVSKEIFLIFGKKYNLDEELINVVSKLIYYHDIYIDQIKEEDLEDIINNFSKEELKLLFALKRADLLAQNPKHHHLLEHYNEQERMLLKIKELRENSDIYDSSKRKHK